MIASRRSFFKTAISLGVATSAYPMLSGCATSQAGSSAPLIADPNGLLDLPEGFTYTAISRTGETMSDGLKVPAAHDGMACFPMEGDADRCILVRNHELDPDEAHLGAYAEGTGVQPDLSYDFGVDGAPLPGGTTTLVYNLKTDQVERSFLSLSGTLRNCSGGLTPWGSWLSCEETEITSGPLAREDHGYVFEVPASATERAVPVALKSMGRFKHEATATDPRTGVVYQTEDQGDSLFYRFLPDVPGELAKGGRLQVLAVRGARGADTRNWIDQRFAPNGAWDVDWLDIEDVTSPDGDLRLRGHAKGAALFARGEGMSFALEQAGSAIYFACTNGGSERLGQIWKYVPSPYEGTADEARSPGRLVLHYESQSAADMDMCDNIVAAPWGDLVVCEDGSNDQFVRGVSPEGQVYPIARNAHPGDSEFAGACFAPDGETLFVNVQTPGTTFAIRGPWASIIRA